MTNGNNNNGKKVNLKRYETDVEGVSLKTLEAGLWWAKNKLILKKISVVFLLLISVISWGYTLYGWGYYLLIGMNRDAQQVKELVQTTTVSRAYLVSRAAKDLSISIPGTINNAGKFDLYVLIKNPNAGHLGFFSYCFKGGGKEICGNDFILPGEQKYIMALAQEFAIRPTNVNFFITDTNWQKIDRHKISDWKEYHDSRLNISIKNAVFIPAASSEGSEKAKLNVLNFIAANEGAYSYWETSFTITLSGFNKVVSVNKYTIKDFLSHEEREIKISWPGAVGTVSKIDIIPDINIMDESVYK